MRFRNSLRLLMENFKHVYKLLWAKLIIGVIASALCCAFVLPELIHIWHHDKVQILVEQGKEFLSLTFSGNTAEMGKIKEEIFGKGGSLSQVTDLLSSMTWKFVLMLCGCVLVYLIRRFAETICHFTTGSMLNDKMATYAESTYATSFVANLGKASAYSAVYVPLVFLFDVVILGVVYLILATFHILVALFFAVTAIALLQALKLTVTNSWLPAMTADGKGIKAAMKDGDKRERRQKFKMFSTYLVSIYLVIVINVMAAICSFGSALLISVPASYFFLICMQYVNYYTLKGNKYFLTYEQIASNPDHGDSEHFFEYLSEESEKEVAEENE